MKLPRDGRRRVRIDSVRPAVDGGAARVKRVVGESLAVEAAAIVDGHEQLACLLRHRRRGEDAWRETPMRPLGDDVWAGAFECEALGIYAYTVRAWIDEFRTWRQRFGRRRERADLAEALHEGAELVAAAAARAEHAADDAHRADAPALHAFAARLAGAEPLEERRAAALSAALDELMARHPDRTLETEYELELEAVVERPIARFGAWYEFFPRSCVTGDETHGTFASAEARLEYVAALGFDVVYLPPIHPIGESRRKGPNNALVAAPGDPGSPWAIGGAGGGHKAVHAALGTLADFRRFRGTAERLGLEIALDIAFQCSPDHPYVREHPQWFRHRSDGSVQYAENPPKKYEDIYPFDFTTGDWRALWQELRDVVLFWVDEGVKVFRVDNPHTKPFAFWEWLIADVQERHPDTVFLAEAFARPRVMYRLGKLGFSQSYTYFTWRNTKRELIEYFTDLAARRDCFRPNLWPNTPDILHEYLQFGGRPAFMSRAVLAATLGASYGVYGPAFELLQAAPREPHSEEYLDSEKYQVRRWDLDAPDSLADFLARLNAIRRENPALHSDDNLEFCPIDNEQLIAYAKRTDDLTDIALVVVNLDPHHPQTGFLELPLDRWGIDEQRPYQAHDQLSGARYLWSGRRNFVALDPHRSPAHVFRLRRHVGTERDFDYFM